MTGYVYAIGCGDAVKIGFSNEPMRRAQNLRTGNPGDAELLGFIEATCEQERELHRLLASARMRGEWFRRSHPWVAHFLSLLPMIKVARGCVGKSATKLGDYLSDCNISLTDFAKKIGVSPEAVRKYKEGERFPKREHLRRIAEVTENAVMPNDFAGVPSQPAVASGIIA